MTDMECLGIGKLRYRGFEGLMSTSSAIFSEGPSSLDVRSVSYNYVNHKLPWSHPFDMVALWCFA